MFVILKIVCGYFNLTLKLIVKIMKRGKSSSSGHSSNSGLYDEQF